MQVFAIDATRLLADVLSLHGFDTPMTSCLVTLMATVILLVRNDAQALERLNMPALALAVSDSATRDAQRLLALAIVDMPRCFLPHSLVLGAMRVLLPSVGVSAGAVPRGPLPQGRWCCRLQCDFVIINERHCGQKFSSWLDD